MGVVFECFICYDWVKVVVVDVDVDDVFDGFVGVVELFVVVNGVCECCYVV